MTLRTDLLPYQIAAVEKLSKIKIGALYMEMGTGKTRTALELINQRLQCDKVNYVLWLCPCSVKNNLRADIIKHVGYMPDIFRIDGLESLSHSDKLYIDLLQLMANKKVYLIIDESNLVKNHRAIRTDRLIRFSELCSYKLILNGTPISKNEADLFAQWYILDWRILGYKSYWSFSNNHLEYDEYGKIKSVLNIPYITRKIAPYTYQVKKNDCINLPPQKYAESNFYLEEKQRLHYEDVKEDFLANVDEFDSTTIYRLFNALQHVTTGNRVLSAPTERILTELFFKNPYDNPRIKCLLEDIRGIEHKTIIWCKFSDEIKYIENKLKELYGKDSVVTFYGELSQKERNVNIEKFKCESQFFVANKTCGGYGLNLQFCSNMIYYNNDWDWSTRAQSEDRIHRIGQEKDVFITDIYASQTLDGRILDNLQRKGAMVDNFKRELSKLKDRQDISKWLDERSIDNDKIGA